MVASIENWNSLKTLPLMRSLSNWAITVIETRYSKMLMLSENHFQNSPKIILKNHWQNVFVANADKWIRIRIRIFYLTFTKQMVWSTYNKKNHTIWDHTIQYNTIQVLKIQFVNTFTITKLYCCTTTTLLM